jgi:radical SAM protein with 4Fe4S-binding SPASM domain
VNNDTLRLVFWELTAHCNLACRHCRAEAQSHAVTGAGALLQAHVGPSLAEGRPCERHADKRRPYSGEHARAADPVAGELGTDEILGVARDIRTCADPIVVLTGGEPLVRDDFYTIAEACAGMFTRVALATNGTLVDDAAARRIAAAKVQRASISLDGADAQTHDAFRGLQGSFASALNGFDALKRAGVSVQANVTVARHNVNQLEALLELARARGADAFHVFVLVPVGCGAEIGAAERLSPSQVEEALRWLFEKSLELRDRLHVKATCAPQYYRIMREVSKERGIQGGGPRHGMQAVTRGCLAGSAVCFISRIGDVQPCGYLPLCAGNVRQTEFGDIWRESDVFAALRDPGQLKGKCGACGYRRVCAGCRARAYAATADFLGEDQDCTYNPDEVRK